MKFHILLAGFASFLFCLGIHILIWRIRHPKRHALTLLAIFLLPVLPALPLVHTLWPELSMINLAAIMLLHAALSCAYIQIYPASQADSPSLKLLIHVHESMPRGMTAKEIYRFFDQSHLFEARILDLLNAGLVRKTDVHLLLTPKGRALILPFFLFRSVLGLPTGRG